MCENNFILTLVPSDSIADRQECGRPLIIAIELIATYHRAMIAPV